MHRIDIRSRLGNLILGLIGAAYALAALSVLVYYWATSGEAGSLVLQILLMACIAGSFWFVLIASGNLRGRRLRH
ncbi:MAG TPA: hypothetical protein VGR02_04275 [Thermoanaerobaculia bacterium]|jgi:hypothetical protein|nr:hypothetical protein [Thermoanaerobaculia bacterium]